MDGILCINKPQNYTSFDVVARIRGMSKTKRVGHSGTLDPMATGVLPVFIGKATKACDRIPCDRKEYVADFQFGQTTDSQDSSGVVLSQTPSFVTPAQLEKALQSFQGEVQQIPPMFSAIQINGQRLYDIARKGGVVERQPRTITLFCTELLDFDQAAQCGRLRVACSKGTYIRTICHDLGAMLGVGAVMTGLVRTYSNGFALADCITLEQAQELVAQGTLAQSLLPVSQVFCELPKITLDSVQSSKFRNGVQLDLNRLTYQASDSLQRVFDDQDTFMGVAALDLETMSLVIEKMF